MELQSGKRIMMTSPSKTPDLPFELAADIFSRLPFIDVFMSCKLVCKLWKTYISHPEFSKVYFSSQKYSHVILFTKNNFIRIFRLKSNKPRRATMIPDCWKYFRDCNDKLVGSCNGLVCLLHQSKASNTYDYLSVSNPMTQEFRLVRAPPKIDLHEEQFMFGFSRKTREYKILRIYKQKGDDHSTRAQVYTVDGSETGWRAIVNQHIRSPRFNGDDDVRGVSFNGALHWITRDKDRDEDECQCLVSFDIAKENTQQIPLPVGTNHGDWNLGLGVLRGCVCVFQNKFKFDGRMKFYYPHRLNIWSMKEHGVMESWVKETVKHPFASHWRLRTCHPVVHLNHNEMVTLDWDICSCKDVNWPTDMVSYNRGKKQSGWLNNKILFSAMHDLYPEDVEDVFRDGGEIAPYSPSLLPLDYLLGGKRS